MKPASTRFGHFMAGSHIFAAQSRPAVTNEHKSVCTWLDLWWLGAHMFSQHKEWAFNQTPQEKSDSCDTEFCRNWKIQSSCNLKQSASSLASTVPVSVETRQGRSATAISHFPKRGTHFLTSVTAVSRSISRDRLETFLPSFLKQEHSTTPCSLRGFCVRVLHLSAYWQLQAVQVGHICKTPSELWRRHHHQPRGSHDVDSFVQHADLTVSQSH